MKSEVGSRKSEVGSRKSEVGSQKSEVRSWNGPSRLSYFEFGRGTVCILSITCLYTLTIVGSLHKQPKL